MAEVDGGQCAIGVLAEILVARRVEQVEDGNPVPLERHHRGRRHRNTALLLDLHPVRARPPRLAARLDLTGDMDGAAEQQQLFRQGGLAGVGMRDDGKGPPPRRGMFGRDRACGDGQGFSEGHGAYYRNCGGAGVQSAGGGVKFGGWNTSPPTKWGERWNTSPPTKWGEREGPMAKPWEGEVGASASNTGDMVNSSADASRRPQEQCVSISLRHHLPHRHPPHPPTPAARAPPSPPAARGERRFHTALP